MDTRRRVLGIARHGDTPKDEHGLSLDSLTDKSVQSMYIQGRMFDLTDAGRGVKSDRVFVLHSDKKRTVSTARARLAGIRGMPKPSVESDLEEFNFDGTLFICDDRLSYESLKLNDSAMKKMGLPAYTDWMLANRYATEMEGKPVTSFQQIYDSRKPVLGDAVRRMIVADHDLGIISTHGVISDAIAMAAVDSARSTPVDRFEEIGGQFNKEDIAYLVIDSNAKSGRTSSKLVRGKICLPVNLDKISQEY